MAMVIAPTRDSVSAIASIPALAVWMNTTAPRSRIAQESVLASQPVSVSVMLAGKESPVESQRSVVHLVIAVAVAYAMI